MMEYLITLGQLLIVVFCLSKLAVSVSEKLPSIKLFNIIRPYIGCRSCMSFWLTLVLGGSLFTAASIWLVMYFYTLKLEATVEKIRL